MSISAGGVSTLLLGFHRNDADRSLTEVSIGNENPVCRLDDLREHREDRRLAEIFSTDEGTSSAIVEDPGDVHRGMDGRLDI